MRFGNGIRTAMIAGSLAGAGTAAAATLDHAPYGTTQDGRAVEIYTLTNDHGLRVRFLSYGGVITEIDVPDRRGRLDDIVLGLSNIHEYETLSAHYGAITGRFANRIGGAQFTLDSQTYNLSQQRPQHAARRTQRARQPDLDGDARFPPPRRVRRHARQSQDGEHGLPGELERRPDLTGLLTNDNPRIDYMATTDKRHGHELHQPRLLQPGRPRLGSVRGQC